MADLFSSHPEVQPSYIDWPGVVVSFYNIPADFSLSTL